MLNTLVMLMWSRVNANVMILLYVILYDDRTLIGFLYYNAYELLRFKHVYIEMFVFEYD